MMDSGMMNGWGMGLGPVFMLLIATMVIFLIISLIRSLFGNSSSNKTITALEILEERFARGEIDETEFDSRRKKLGQ